MAESKKALKIALSGNLFLDKEKTGISYMAENISKTMIENNPQSQFFINIFDKNVNGSLELFDYNNVDVIRNSKMKYWKYKIISSFIPIPYKSFFKEDVDITQFFNYIIFPGVKGKKITIVHDMAYKFLPETVTSRTKFFLNLNMKRTIKRADVILTVSEFSKKEILRAFKVEESKIRVIPCIINKELFNTNYNEQQIETAKEKYSILSPYFLYLGTLEPRKNIVKQIEAYALFKKNTKNDIKLVLAGKKGWMYEDIFKKVKQLGLEADVIFTGYIDISDAPLLMMGSVAFLYVSLYEGFGMPPLEAMSCGVPVIVSNVASLPEVVGDAGIMVDPSSIEEISKAMQRIAEDKDFRIELSKKSIQRSEKFSVQKSAEDFYHIYEEITG